jgi:hypothetical protein
MTLARTALRLATVAALQGADSSSGPTIACNRVYDSRIDDFSPETYPDDAKPTIIILTDADDGEALSEQNGGPPFRRNIKLVFEFAMVQGFDVPVENGGTAFVPGYPATDAEHEASLDFLEFQIAERLAQGIDRMPILWRSFSRVRKSDCHRQVLDDSGVKIAARVLTWECEVTDDQMRIHNPNHTTPVGFNLLPEPLRRVALALPDGPAFEACVAMAKALTPITADALTNFNVKFDEKDLKMNFNAEIAGGNVAQVIASEIAGQIDYQQGIGEAIGVSYQNLVLDQTIAALSVVGWPRFGIEARLVLQITNSGDFTVTAWPAGTVWVGGNAPAITQGAGKKDMIALTTPDGGATIFGTIVGQDFH